MKKRSKVKIIICFILIIIIVVAFTYIIRIFLLGQEAIEENLRLLYVAVTRAKKRLYLTTSKKYRFKTEPNEIFNLIEENKNASILA